MNNFLEEAYTAIAALDDDVGDTKADLPSNAANAVAFAAATVANNDNPTCIIEMFVAMCKQCYRLGYKNGRQDLHTTLIGPAGKG